MTIDPRLAERRREVAEDRARRNVSRLVKFLIALGVAGVVVWAFLSPWLSIASISTIGINVSTAASTLEDHRVVEGTPMILIRTGQVERALEKDPWVRESEVVLDWPRTVRAVQGRTDLSEAVKRKLLHDNALLFYGPRVEAASAAPV